MRQWTVPHRHTVTQSQTRVTLHMWTIGRGHRSWFFSYARFYRISSVHESLSYSIDRVNPGVNAYSIYRIVALAGPFA